MTISFKRDPQGTMWFYVELQYGGMTFVGRGLSLRAARHQANLAAAEAIEYV